MNYKVGDKVELESGKIVTITKIVGCLENENQCYAYGNPGIVISEKIIKKIEE